jgi:pimeloyl-ACP methyl ester carboxylesterase
MTRTSSTTKGLALATALVSITLAACGSSPATSTASGSPSVTSAPAQVARTPLGTVGYRLVGHGPPLVLIMGYAATMEVWDPRFVDAQARLSHARPR